MVNLLFEAHVADLPVNLLEFPELASLVIAMEPVVQNAGVSEEDMQLREEAARMEGYRQGLAAGEQRRWQEIETEHSAVQMLCSSFANERTRYFADAEAEVVKLSLAIAAHVLQQELSTDPTMLCGLVNTTLSKLGDAKGAVLRMFPTDVDVWRDAMKHAAIEIVGDETMLPGRVRLEVAGSAAELGIPQQMQEIERGFFDLLKRRPA